MTGIECQKELETLLKTLYRICCIGQTEMSEDNCTICDSGNHSACNCPHNAFNTFRKERS